jgi:hypothetical protein
VLSPLADDPESLIPASLPPGWAAMRTVQEGFHGPVMIAQCLLLDHLGALA